MLGGIKRHQEIKKIGKKKLREKSFKIHDSNVNQSEFDLLLNIFLFRIIGVIHTNEEPTSLWFTFE